MPFDGVGLTSNQKLLVSPVPFMPLSHRCIVWAELCCVSSGLYLGDIADFPTVVTGSKVSSEAPTPLLCV